MGVRWKIEGSPEPVVLQGAINVCTKMSASTIDWDFSLSLKSHQAEEQNFLYIVFPGHDNLIITDKLPEKEHWHDANAV